MARSSALRPKTRPQRTRASKPPPRASTRGRPAPTPFSAELITDEESGSTIVQLAYRSDRKPLESLRARVAPWAGSNLYSLKLGEDELLLQPAALRDLVDQRAGTPLMFPTPNRVREAQMTFEGRRFVFEANSGHNFIHGLARRRPFQVGRLQATGRGASAETILEWDDRQPEFGRFPLRHRLTMTYTLRRGGLRIAYQVDNRDGTRLPFGFGLHPYFRILAARSDVFLHVPLARRMEAEALLPTGKLLPVSGTAHDLRRDTTLAGLALDDVYFGMVPGKEASFELRDRGVRVALSGSAAFTHLVVYTPPDRDFFCIENQTSSTDAHNLAAAGARRVAHLQVIPPGKRAVGHVDWSLRRLPLPARPEQES